jgi:hypothetical protein
VKPRNLLAVLIAGVLAVAAAVPTAAHAATAVPTAAHASELHAPAPGGWSVVPAPNPTVRYTNLQSVDARTDADAWAVGYVQPPVPPSTVQPVALHWDGTAWSATGAPRLGHGTQLWAVSASRADDVWAVGSYSVPAGNRVLSRAAALHWDGRAWKAVDVPGLPVLSGVVNLAPGDAWAVGGGGVAHWNGGAWTAVPTPSPNPGHPGRGSLTAVSASAPDDVWAIGTFESARHITTSFSLHFDGVAWSLVPMPEAATRLFSIDVVGPRDAWAVGEIDGADTQPVVEHWNGTGWSIVASPSFPEGAFLRDVSARGPGDVWAAGLTFTGDTAAVHPLTLHWDGAAWTATGTVPVASSDLLSVSARAGNDTVWAVGTTYPGVPLIIERH